MKDIELRLVSELMKNSRRSDRDLAKVIGVSQPTVSRTIRRLEKEGLIKEYTMIPDFSKLGLRILAITFLKRPKDIVREDLEKAMEMGKDLADKYGLRSILAYRGMGLGYDVAVISVHEDYSGYLEAVKAIKEFPYSDVSSVQSFMINLTDELQYRPLTLSYLAKYLSTVRAKRGKT